MSCLLVQMQRGKSSRTQNGPRAVLVGEDSAEKGLSLLVQQVLGRPLDKTEQMSNWNKRPLRVSQIRYAGKALMQARAQRAGARASQENIKDDFFPLLLLLLPVTDAYCLLDLYSALSTNPEGFGLPGDLHSVSPSQSAQSGIKKQKEKRAHGKEVRRSPTTSSELRTEVEHQPAGRDHACLTQTQFLWLQGCRRGGSPPALTSLHCGAHEKKESPCGNRLSITPLSVSI